jgi:hypothetical protein
LSDAATATPEKVHPYRSRPVRVPGKGYTFCRVMVRESSRTRNSMIEVRGAIRRLEEALREEGIEQGVSINSANRAEGVEHSVMTIQVQNDVDKNVVYGVVDHMLRRMALEFDGLDIALVYEDAESSAATRLPEMGRRRDIRANPPEGTVRRPPVRFTRPALGSHAA